jgi:hypothetical protein
VHVAPACVGSREMSDHFEYILYLSAISILQPITLALVYVGTTLKDLSDVTHGWSEISTTRWVSNDALFHFATSCCCVSHILFVLCQLLAHLNF